MNLSPREIFHFNYKNENYLSSCAPVFQELRESGKLCDVDIKLRDRTISAHKIILAATLPYFYRMICSASPENGKKMEIYMKEFDSDTIEALINFCYTGKIQITSDNIEKIFFCANLFGLPDMRGACVEHLKLSFTPTNVINFKRIAERIRLDTLIPAATEFICRNFLQVSITHDFLGLKPQEFLEIIERDDLRVSAEQEVYETAMRWLQYDPSRRVSLLPQLLKRVRLTLLPANYLVDVVSKEKLIRTSLECRDILDEAKNFLIFMKGDSIPRLRNGQSHAEVIYVVYGSNVGSSLCNTLKNSIWKYEQNQWEKVTELLKMKMNFRGTVMNNKIYVIGGMTGKDYSSSTEIFDPQTSEWSEGKNLIEKRRFFGVVTLNNCIYACGGAGIGNSVMNSVESFSDSQNEWRKVTPLNECRALFNVVALNGFVYAVGGWGGNKPLSTCERYCPTENKWIFMKPMTRSRFGLGVAVLRGKIYACGGQISKDECLNSCEVYDPETNCWSSIAPMQDNRSNFALAACNGKLIAIGGYPLSSVEEYYSDTNQWKYLTPLPGVACGTVAVTMSR